MSGFSAACPLFVLTLLPPRLVFWTGVLGISGLVQPWRWCVCSWAVLGRPFGGRWLPLSVVEGVYAPRLHVLVLQRFLGLLLRKDGRHCLWWQGSALLVFVWSWGLGGGCVDDVRLFLSPGAGVCSWSSFGRGGWEGEICLTFR